tara:strand:+ start:1734 stop:2900 length:1167 start_codon:yes stop_codon:yes gene_type:complete
MINSIKKCYNTEDFRYLAKRRLPFPIFHYIDGAADDEVTLRRNTKAYEEVDLVPNVLKGVKNIDISTEIMGKKISAPLFFSPTALQRLFHYEGEIAVGKAAEEFNTFFGISSLATTSIEEVGNKFNCPKIFQMYIHKDKGLNDNMIDKCKANNFDAIAITLDTIVGGNRERDLRTGFTSPPKLDLISFFSYLTHPNWTLNYLLRNKFELPQLQDFVDEGTNINISVGDYFSTMLDQSITWKDIEDIKNKWNGHLCLKGIMSVEDAKKSLDVGATAIMVSNHGGRQLDGGRAPFDQLEEIIDAVGDKIDVICDGGIRRGSHVIKALSLGAKACSGGRFYLYALACAGHLGVKRAYQLMQDEIIRDMKLMGCRSIDELCRNNLRFRKSLY